MMAKLLQIFHPAVSQTTFYHPTVVAPGIDVVTTHPTKAPKTPEQEEKDKQFISPDKLDSHTVVSGTSFAAPSVSGAIANIIGFLEEHKIQGHQKLQLTVQVGTIANILVIDVDTSPANIKKIVTQLAIPMPSYGFHEVGAGFISRDYTAQLFGDYASSSKLMPVKIV
jgi:hypothetical protein